MSETLALLSLKDILASAHVHRWHMIRVKRTQTLAEHAFTVALLGGKLASLLEPGELLRVQEHNILLAALLHDLHEIKWGDMPTPVKWFIESQPGGSEILAAMKDKFWAQRGLLSPPEFSLVVRRIVKLADRMEAALFYGIEGEDPDIYKRLKGEALEMAHRDFSNHPALLAFVGESLA